jgi:hypothetical protein
MRLKPEETELKKPRGRFAVSDSAVRVRFVMVLEVTTRNTRKEIAMRALNILDF